jgi:hypothetical protein
LIAMTIMHWRCVWCAILLSQVVAVPALAEPAVAPPGTKPGVGVATKPLAMMPLDRATAAVHALIAERKTLLARSASTEQAIDAHLKAATAAQRASASAVVVGSAPDTPKPPLGMSTSIENETNAVAAQLVSLSALQQRIEAIEGQLRGLIQTIADGMAEAKAKASAAQDAAAQQLAAGITNAAAAATSATAALGTDGEAATRTSQREQLLARVKASLAQLQQTVPSKPTPKPSHQ